MQKLLTRLYIEGLHPGEGRFISDPGYKKLLNNIASVQEQLCGTFTDEQKALWEEFMANIEVRGHTESTQVFIDGFRLGARIMMECLAE